MAFKIQEHAADDTIALLRQCVAAPAYLFDCSLGGMVALMVAAQASGDVRAYVTCASQYKFYGSHIGVLYGNYDLLDRLRAYKVRPELEDPRAG
jgi:pimeloyl-ACP methyl ester carboxylesterase